MRKLELDFDLAKTIKALNQQIVAYTKKYGTQTERYENFINSLKAQNIELGISKSGYVKIQSQTKQPALTKEKAYNLLNKQKSGQLTLGKQKLSLENLYENFGESVRVNGTFVNIKKDTNKALALEKFVNDFMKDLPTWVYDTSYSPKGQGHKFETWDDILDFVIKVENEVGRKELDGDLYDSDLSDEEIAEIESEKTSRFKNRNDLYNAIFNGTI